MGSVTLLWWVFGPTIGVTVVGSVAIWWVAAAQVRELRSIRHMASGRVTALGIDRGDGISSPTYWAEVSCSRDTFTARVGVSPDRYRTLQTGSQLDVTYLPGRPQSARVLDAAVSTGLDRA